MCSFCRYLLSDGAQLHLREAAEIKRLTYQEALRRLEEHRMVQECPSCGRWLPYSQRQCLCQLEDSSPPSPTEDFDTTDLGLEPSPLNDSHYF